MAVQPRSNGSAPNTDALMAKIAELEAKLAAKTKVKPTVVKHSALGGVDKNGDPNKGNVSVYGLGRFPVTLYPSQWQRLLPMAEEILAYIEEHKAELAWKD